MSKSLEDLEIDLLLEAIFQRYGYDFRDYSRASITRRVRNHLNALGLAHPTELLPLILHQEQAWARLAQEFSIPVTEMFRDPDFFLEIKTQVLDYLRTYPYVKIWHAGCATGEEVYSLAILLKEANLLDHCTIFATDFNEKALQQAKEGIFPLEATKQYTQNYLKAGGERSFSDYYHAHYESIILDRDLSKRVTFANHNLVSDGVFGEMHLILCRNVLIYFNKALQGRVLKLFYDSLVSSGFLALGPKESLQFSQVEGLFKGISPRWGIYQKKPDARIHGLIQEQLKDDDPKG